MTSGCAVLLLAAALAGCAGTGSAAAQSVPTAGPAVAHPYAADIAEAAHRFGIAASWIAAVLGAESDGDPLAVSSAGAMGLMQLMPETWEEQRALHQLGNEPFQPRDNILAGAAYLRAMWTRYGNVGGMLAAYNFGPGRYDEYLAGERELPQETRDYVAALAPVLGGDPLAPDTLAGPSRVTDWRDAPLFVTAPAGSQHALGQRGERIAGAPSEPPTASAGLLALAPAEALFAARSGSGRAP
ncbi:murein transglycosylase [Aquamicrobium defluvii]|uniref:Murein transglycosylase n=2 Tax=Aquamicrobium defluvii TaxID=69279 RepID=A0A011VQB8_9HYPH|nr:murein transglycosylase [Aquamicrobium defluvii]EZQ17754.1 murein transglycosylase [Halopseudomonas bauzanensis]